METLRNLMSNGKFFTVTFTKKNGELRTINGRCGVHKYVKGVGLGYDPAKKDYVIVREVNQGQYRTINLRTVVRFKQGNKTINL